MGLQGRRGRERAKQKSTGRLTTTRVQGIGVVMRFTIEHLLYSLHDGELSQNSPFHLDRGIVKAEESGRTVDRASLPVRLSATAVTVPPEALDTDDRSQGPPRPDARVLCQVA